MSGNLVCPKCGSLDIVRKGFDNRNVTKQTYKCNRCNARPTEVFTETMYGLHKDSKNLALKNANKIRRIARKSGVKRYVITSAQNATAPWEPWLATLKTFCEHNECELIIMPYRYKNPSAFVWSEDITNQDWWHHDLHEYLVYDNKPIYLNDSIDLMPHILTTPTTEMPLSGLDTIGRGKSCIFPHAKLHARSLPTPQGKHALIISTTGSCTVPNYSATKAGIKGLNSHFMSAIYLETKGKKFNYQTLSADMEGDLIHFDKLYTPDFVSNAPKALALCMGDSHIWYMDPKVKQVTFDGPNSLIGLTDPQYLVWHDLLDFAIDGHHEKEDYRFRYLIEKYGQVNVEKEIDETFAFVDEHSKGRNNVIVSSNHNEHIDRWLHSSSPSYHINAPFFLRLKADVMERGYIDNNRVIHKASALEILAENKLKSFDRTEFTGRGGGYYIGGFDTGCHGDKGANGSRGSAAGFKKLSDKIIFGHGHSFFMYNNVIQLGTSSLLELSYNSGYSSWIHENAIINANNEATVVIITDGTILF